MPDSPAKMLAVMESIFLQPIVAVWYIAILLGWGALFVGLAQLMKWDQRVSGKAPLEGIARRAMLPPLRMIVLSRDVIFTLFTLTFYLLVWTIGLTVIGHFSVETLLSLMIIPLSCVIVMQPMCAIMYAVCRYYLLTQGLFFLRLPRWYRASAR